MGWCHNVRWTIIIAWIALLSFHAWGLFLFRLDGDGNQEGRQEGHASLLRTLVPNNSSSPWMRGPIHSWKTVPVSFHACRPDTRGPTGLEFHPQDLEALKRYPLITLEKWQGTLAFSTNQCQNSTNEYDDDNTTCWNATTKSTDGASTSSETNIFFWTDEAWIAAARQIKAVHPTASIAVWMDTMLIYTGWSWPPPPKYTQDNLNRTLNPDIGVHCSDGYFRPAEFLEGPGSFYRLMNSSGLPALESWSHCHVYDHTQAHVRQYWKELCLNMTMTGLIDGCGADFSALEANQWSTHTTDYIQTSLGLDAEVAKAWNTGHRLMMQEVTTALQQQHGGYLIGKDPFELGDHVNAVLQESCPARNETIELLQNLTATSHRLNQRLIYQCHTSQLTESILAAFLCGAGPDHYITLGPWRGDRPGFPSHWHPFFEKPLGEPLNGAIYNPETTLWTRCFASGTVVKFNATSSVGTIQWSDTFVEPVDLRES